MLLDELAVGTDPQTGQAIGQAVLEELTKKNTISVVTTHFDNLKGLAEGDKDFQKRFDTIFKEEPKSYLQTRSRYSWSKFWYRSS